MRDSPAHQPRRPIFVQGPIEGSITEGKLADLVVLDRDPRTVEPEELNTLRAELTMIDGPVMFDRG